MRSIQQVPPISRVNATTVIDSIFESNLPQVFIIVIFLVIIIPVVLDLYLAYTRRPKGSTERAVGMSGLYRALMTFGVLLLMGTVIFYVLALITLNLVQSTSPVLQSLIESTEEPWHYTWYSIGNDNCILFWNERSRNCSRKRSRLCKARCR